MAPEQPYDAKQTGKQMAALFVALAAVFALFFAVSTAQLGSWIVAGLLTVLALAICYKVFYSKKT